MILKSFLFKNYLTLSILLIALFFRIYGLGLNPVGIVHDEVHDLVNAKSIALTGIGAPGTVAGIFTPQGFCEGNCIFGELVSFILVPWMKIFPLDIFFSKIPFVLASLGIVYFTGKLFENLSGKKSVGLIVSLLVAINPWAIHFGRTAFENLFAFCFYLWGLYLFTKKDASKKDLILAVLVSFLGLLSYMGAKPIFPFIVLWGVIFNLFKNKFKFLKVSLLVLVFAAVLFVGYFLVLKNSEAGKRLTEIGLSNDIKLQQAQLVNDQRRLLLDLPGRDLFINKYSVAIPDLLTKYLGVFNANYLFNQGELNLGVFMIPNHSYLYLLDFPLIMLGIIAATVYNPLTTIFLFLLLAFLPITSALSSVHITYALRAGLVFPLLVGLSGWGIYYLYKNSGKFSKFIIAFIVFAYLISFIYFSAMYFYKTPAEKSVSWFFHERTLVRYLTLLPSDQKVILIVKSPLDFLYEYAFFSGKYETPDYISQFNQNLKNKNYQINQIKITNNCNPIINLELSLDTTYIVQQGFECEGVISKGSIKIADPRDSGQQYTILNDTVCKGYKLSRYPYPRDIRQFLVENIDQETFCKTWITNPDLPI